MSFKGYSVNRLSHVPHIRDIISLNTYTVNRICHFSRLRPHVTAPVHQNQLSTAYAKEGVLLENRSSEPCCKRGGSAWFVPLGFNWTDRLQRTGTGVGWDPGPGHTARVMRRHQDDTGTL